jgi:thiamine pyrophosphokinase
MPRTFIFANGELNPPTPAPDTFASDAWIIAADGGALHCKRLGITPHTLIGDFDSLSSAQMEALVQAGVEIIRHPANKDETDLELALLHAIQQGSVEIVVYGALGARMDMTLANLMLLTHPAFTAVRLRLVDGNQEISLLQRGETIHVQGKPGDTISLIPLSPTASGVTTQALEYPLSDGTLFLGSPRGVSNTMLGDTCDISLGEGVLAIVHIGQTF